MYKGIFFISMIPAEGSDLDKVVRPLSGGRKGVLHIVIHRSSALRALTCAYLTPVSYTHLYILLVVLTLLSLNVWGQDKVAFDVEVPSHIIAGRPFRAVSYTHLDVYKRQMKGSHPMTTPLVNQIINRFRWRKIEWT